MGQKWATLVLLLFIQALYTRLKIYFLYPDQKRTPNPAFLPSSTLNTSLTSSGSVQKCINLHCLIRTGNISVPKPHSWPDMPWAPSFCPAQCGTGLLGVTTRTGPAVASGHHGTGTRRCSSQAPRGRKSAWHETWLCFWPNKHIFSAQNKLCILGIMENFQQKDV